MTEQDLMRKRFPSVSIEAAVQFGTNGIRVGTVAPDFELPDLKGKTIYLRHLRGKSHVVLMFGNLTCGATATQLRAGHPTMRALYTRYRKKGFEFFLIYSRETHPGEFVPQPTSVEERRSHALRLAKEERVNFPILVDSIDNRVRDLYHGWSNGIFVVNKKGLLVFKSAWTYGPEVAQVLSDLLAWERLTSAASLCAIAIRKESSVCSETRRSAPVFTGAPASRPRGISRACSNKKASEGEGRFSIFDLHAL